MRGCIAALFLWAIPALAHATLDTPPVTTDIGTYTVATLPDCADRARMTAWATDLFGGPGDRVICDGVNWKPIRPLALNSAAPATGTLTTLLSAPTQIVIGSIGAGVTQTMTLSTQYAYKGARFRILRKATGLGALVVSVGALINLSLSAWVDMEFDGTQWVQTASGGIL